MCLGIQKDNKAAESSFFFFFWIEHGESSSQILNFQGTGESVGLGDGWSYRLDTEFILWQIVKSGVEFRLTIHELIVMHLCIW